MAAGSMQVGDKGYWDDVYRRKGAEGVSWFQPQLHVSLDIIGRLGLPASARAIDVGGGASTLVDDLLGAGLSDVTVLDVSAEALDLTRRRLGPRAAGVTFIEADIAGASLPEAHYDLWHDRAVFHFLTDRAARARYVETVDRALKPGGHVIVATFGPRGPDKCSGLDVVRYDADGLHQEFGRRFQRVAHLEEAHTTPWGTTQEFVYCHCRRLA